MSVNTKHPAYLSMLDKITKTEAAFAGDVHSYVPRLSGQTQMEWDDYVGRAAYYNVTERTVLALVGALVRKPYKLDNVATEEPLTDESTFAAFIQRCYKTILMQGRVGLHVDYCDEEQSPKLVAYPAQNIINWFDDLVVIEEVIHERNADDPFVIDCITQWRVLNLNQAGQYQVDIWRQTGKDEFKIVDSVMPNVRGVPLNYIPFWFATPYDNSDEVKVPPVYSLADLNVQHFKIAVDIHHAAHFLALPQPWISGGVYTQDGMQPTSITVGRPSFLMLDQGSTVGYLEPSGQGLPFLRELQTSNEQQMYSAGSRLLQVKNGVESAEALQIRAGSESAVLETIASSLEYALVQALTTYNEWAGSTIEPTVTLNKDFTAQQIDPATLKSLIEAYSANVITLDTLLTKLYEGELVKDVEEEKRALEQQEEEQPEPQLVVAVDPTEPLDEQP